MEKSIYRVYNIANARMRNFYLRKEPIDMKYETPVVEIVIFENEDIVTDSLPDIEF